MGLYESYSNQNKEQSNMTITRLKDNVRPADFESVQVKEMGDIIELRYLSNEMGRNYNKKKC